MFTYRVGGFPFSYEDLKLRDVNTALNSRLMPLKILRQN